MMDAASQDSMIPNVIDRPQLFIPERSPSRGVQCLDKQNHGFYTRKLLGETIVLLWKDGVTYTSAPCS